MKTWAPHVFAAVARSKNVPPDCQSALIEEGKRLQAHGLPVIFTLRHLAAICDVPYGLLREVVSRRTDSYRIFNVKKRSGGYRQITVPEPGLMRTQRWIHQNILAKEQTSSISTAYNHGGSPIFNAEHHSQCKWLVKLDITAFFESVSEQQVFKVFRALGFPALLAFELTRLCTRCPPSDLRRKSRRWSGNKKSYTIHKYKTTEVGHLPQGAPTSPMLANLVCRELDVRLIEIASSYGAVVTRYADDIVFSHIAFDRVRAETLIAEATAALAKFGFSRNRTKTQVVPPGARRIVTGLLVDSPSVRLTRRFRDNLRMHLFHARTKGVRAHCVRRKFRSIVGFREHIRGLIAYSGQVDPSYAAKRSTEFHAIEWGVLDI